MFSQWLVIQKKQAGIKPETSLYRLAETIRIHIPRAGCRLSDVSAFITALACKHIPIASQLILRSHQNTGD
jgi:hypothetical protein